MRCGSVRNRFHEVHVIGSGPLVVSAQVPAWDRLNPTVYPADLGMGKDWRWVAVPASFG